MASASLTAAADVVIDSIGVGPIGLDGDSGKSFLADQPLGDLRPFPVKLVRAVRRLADQHEASVTDKLEERVVVVGRAAQRLSGVAHGLGQDILGQFRYGCGVHDCRSFS